MSSVTMLEYENKVFDISVAADRLTAVIALLNAHYFESTPESMESLASRARWCISYGDLQEVMGAVSVMAFDMKKALSELCEAALCTP